MAKHVKDIYGWLKWRLAKDPEWAVRRLSPKLEKKENGCMCWAGKGGNGAGYKTISVRDQEGNHRSIYVHRLFWVLKNKRNIRYDRQIDHMCEDKTCVSCLQEVAPITNNSYRHGKRRRDIKFVSEQA